MRGIKIPLQDFALKMQGRGGGGGGLCARGGVFVGHYGNSHVTTSVYTQIACELAATFVASLVLTSQYCDPFSL